MTKFCVRGLAIGEWLIFAAGLVLLWEPRLGAKLGGLGLILLEGHYSPRGAAPTGAVVSLGEVNNLGHGPW